jgi:hypothetical protein
MLAAASTSSLHPPLQHCQQNITFHYEKLMNIKINEVYGFTIIPEILDIEHHSTLKAHNISHTSSISLLQIPFHWCEGKTYAGRPLRKSYSQSLSEDQEY